MPYELKRVQTPSLRGLALHLFTMMVESSVTRPLLLPGLLSTSGVREFRRLRPESDPTPHPPPGPVTSPSDETDVIRKGRELANQISETAPPPGSMMPSTLDYATAYRNGTTTPQEIADRVVDAVNHSNQQQPPLRAIIKCSREDVMQQATDSAERLANGKPRSVLEGVPVAIKDEMDLTPYGTSVGTRFKGGTPAAEDCAAASRLRAAGALLIGKTNMYEIGIAPLGNNPIHGFARNPWNTDHDSGGSSSGCGNAVAAGIVPLAIGADGGGSVRVPAALCGITGLKPTFGRISGFGSAGLCHSVGHIGPLGATALDVAVGYAVCAGPDAREASTLTQPNVHLTDWTKSDLSGIRLGIYRPWFDDADNEIVAACDATVRRLVAAGAQVVDVEINLLEEVRLSHAVSILSEMVEAVTDDYERHRTDFALPTRINLALGRQFTAEDYDRAQRLRTDALAEWARVMSQVDVVLTPSTATAAPKITPGSERSGESNLFAVTSMMHYMLPGNLCGLPAVSFPAGFTSDGLPVGLQAIGNYWDEHVLLRLVHTAEETADHRLPPTFYEPLKSVLS